jgi:hypothetical protein
LLFAFQVILRPETIDAHMVYAVNIDVSRGIPLRPSPVPGPRDVHSLIFEVDGPIFVLPPKANIREHDWHVRGLPTADISVAALWPINHKVGEKLLEQS